MQSHDQVHQFRCMMVHHKDIHSKQSASSALCRQYRHQVQLSWWSTNTRQPALHQLHRTYRASLILRRGTAHPHLTIDARRWQVTLDANNDRRLVTHRAHHVLQAHHRICKQTNKLPARSQQPARQKLACSHVPDAPVQTNNAASKLVHSKAAS